MTANIKPTQLQKILLFLDLNSRTHRQTYFQDIQNHLRRSKFQVSMLLSQLEGEGLIEKDDRRPQSISITDVGKERIDAEFISPIKSYLPKHRVQLMESNPSKREDKYVEKISSELIQGILSEIEVGLEGDLELIQEFITREVFSELKARVLETIEPA